MTVIIKKTDCSVLDKGPSVPQAFCLTEETVPNNRTQPELFILSLVCVKWHYPFKTCHSESVINNVVSYTSAQKQVGLVKPLTQKSVLGWSKSSNVVLFRINMYFLRNCCLLGSSLRFLKHYKAAHCQMHNFTCTHTHFVCFFFDN